MSPDISAGRPRPRLIHRAVTEQARLRPDAPAVIDGPSTLTYATLDRAADVLAAQLWEHGVRPGSLVPIALPRGARLIAVLLAVLKCGAAYAALDTGWPPARLRQVVARLAGPVAVGAVPAGSAPAVWWPPDEPLVHTARRTAAAPAAAVEPTAPACVFFTSGTTGAPRGVLSPHAATMRLFGAESLAGLGPGRVMAQAAPVAWDAFTLEVWGPLTTGGSCAVAGTGAFLPEDLRDLRATAGVNTLWLTSALFNLFVDEDPDCFAGLGTVLTGGERLSPAHVASFLRRHPDIALINGYGPVETCVFATSHRVRPQDCAGPYGIPVGVPVPGTAVHLVDGEICVSGDGLAVGYLKDPRATAERFTTLDTPAGPLRVYRTGDLGALDAAGVLHFHGRADGQVKIAGHRVEPGEVEAHARGVPGIRHCAVVPVPGAEATPTHLALFYTPQPARPVRPTEVRRALAAVLPRPLVPAVVCAVERLPVTANGKVDRACLLAGLTPTTDPTRSLS